MPRPTISELDALVASRHRDPHLILGRHLEDGKVVHRVMRPDARDVWIHQADKSTRMALLHPGGVFELKCEGGDLPPPGGYRVELREQGEVRRHHDPYAFSPTIGDLDLHLVGEGKHHELYRVLGAHVLSHQGVQGTSFGVWAPAARRVSVVGDFNGWDERIHPMRYLGPGVWELFVPGLGAGALYKFAILTASGEVAIKADPLAREMELRPSTASRVAHSEYVWGDGDWLEQRRGRDPAREAMAIYEVHLGSWRHHPGERRHEGRPNWLSYRELAQELVDYVADLGFTHVELLPVMEHPFDGSWGYQVGSYFAPTSRYGTPDDLRYLIDRFHQAGIGVLVDWVPAHFPKDAYALGRFDGTALYEHLDPRKGEHKQWGTYIFNYGRNEVRNFLVANALYWLDTFHVDGLRCDAVASMLYLDYGAQHPGEWTPNVYGGRENLEAIEFLRELTDTVHRLHPGCLVIAEESTAWPGVTHATRAGGLGFDLKWNMGWMHDTLGYFSKDSVFRSFHHNLLTFGLWYAFSERFVLPLSHDEVVHLKRSLLGKMAGDRWRMFANLRALFAHMWAHPGKKLLFMGAELGQWSEWSEEAELDWPLLGDPHHAGLSRLLKDLNALYRDLPALWEADHEPRGFRWVDPNDHLQSVISYLRFPVSGDPEDYLLCAANLTPVPRVGYRVGVPCGARHREVINTDAAIYGGSGMGNLGAVEAAEVPSHGQPHSLELTLPPLSALWLRPDRR